MTNCMEEIMIKTGLERGERCCLLKQWEGSNLSNKRDLTRQEGFLEEMRLGSLKVNRILQLRNERAEHYFSQPPIPIPLQSKNYLLVED